LKPSSREFGLHHVHFQREPGSLFALFGGEEVQSFKSDDAPLAILDQDDIVVGLLAIVFFGRVVESDSHRVSLVIEIDSQLFHNSTPFLTFVVKYAVTTNRSFSSLGATTTHK